MFSFRLAKDCHNSTIPNLVRCLFCFGVVACSNLRAFVFMTYFVLSVIFSLVTRVTFWFVFGVNICIGKVCRRVLGKYVRNGIFGVSQLVQFELVGSSV